MANQSFHAVLQQVRKIAAVRTGRELGDHELLDRFVGARDGAAFTVLLERHGPMVLGVCRRVLGDAHDAEDACQATFLVLARKATSVRKAASLGSWLHRVAGSVAANLRRERSRRQRRERDVQPRTDRDPAAEVSWRDVQAALDEELRQLPERYRTPLIVCYLDGQTRDDAARRLGLTPGTLHGRLERGRKLLCDRLTRRGLALSAVLTALAVGEGTSPAALSPTVVLSSTRAALVFAGGTVPAGTVVPANVIALAQEVLRTMALSKLKHLAVAMMCSAAFVGAVALNSGSAADSRDPAPTVSNLAAADGEPAAGDAVKTTPGTGSGFGAGGEATAAPARTTDVVPQPMPDANPQPKAAPDRPAKAQEVVTKSFSTAKAPRLVVGTFNGPIAVTTGAAGKTEVKVVKTVHAASEESAEADLKNVDVQMRQEADVIHVTAKPADEQKQTSRGAAVELKVPPGARLELKTQNGEVTASGETGDLTVVTANGGIEVKGSKGPLNLQTSNGRIRVEGGSGKLELQTSNGGIDVEAATAAVTARTSNASIRFRGSLAGGEQHFHTRNGNVSLTLPTDASFRLDAQTSNGKASCQFPYKGRDGESKTGLRATVGDNPKTTLVLRTGNGNIDVRPDKDNRVDKPKP